MRKLIVKSKVWHGGGGLTIRDKPIIFFDQELSAMASMVWSSIVLFLFGGMWTGFAIGGAVFSAFTSGQFLCVALPGVLSLMLAACPLARYAHIPTGYKLPEEAQAEESEPTEKPETWRDREPLL